MVEEKIIKNIKLNKKEFEKYFETSNWIGNPNANRDEFVCQNTRIDL